MSSNFNEAKDRLNSPECLVDNFVSYAQIIRQHAAMWSPEKLKNDGEHLLHRKKCDYYSEEESCRAAYDAYRSAESGKVTGIRFDPINFDHCPFRRR